MARKVLMIGSSPQTRGGVAALVNVYAAQGLFGRSGAEYVATHRDGSKARKLAVAARAWLDVMARLASRGVSLLHVHIASDASFWRKSAFVIPARVLGVPYVLHMHGGDFTAFYRRAQWPGREPFIRWIYRGASRVIALSEEWRDALESVEPRLRVVVIPNPVEIPSARAALDLGPPRVLFLGVLAERKGVHDLLHAWSQVLRRVAGARLVLAGQGADDAVAQLARELGVHDSVEMPGWVSSERRAALLREAWVFTLPSHIEALPMAVLEAMAAGVPVVAARVGGIPTAVEHGRSGILVEPRDVGALADALASLLADRGRRVAMGAAARARAERMFSAEVIVPRIESLWAEVLGGDGRVAP